MSYLNTALDEYAEYLASQTSLPVVRDPALVLPPCLFLDIPTVTGQTQGATTLAVPVALITDPPADLRAADELMDLLPDVLTACGEANAEPRPVPLGDHTYPAMVVTATITISRSS